MGQSKTGLTEIKLLTQLYVHKESGEWAFSAHYGRYYDGVIKDNLRYGDRLCVVEIEKRNSGIKYYVFHERLKLYTQMWTFEIQEHLTTNKPFDLNEMWNILNDDIQ